MPTSRPPYSTGQLTTDQRSSYMVRSQARWASKPSAVSREGRGSVGTCAPNHARASARKASCSASKVRSMTEGNLPQRSCPCQGVGRGGRRSTPSADRNRCLVLHDRAHEEVDHRFHHLGFGGHLAHRVELVPTVVHGQQLAWHTVHAEVPGQLLRLLRIDDLVVVRVEDEEGR